MPPITPLLAALGDTSATFTAPQVSAWRDQELIDGQRSIAEARRRLDALAAAVAGEIAYRSRRELGHGGLAQSRGQRTAEGLISQLGGTSAREARTLVKAGELLQAEREVRSEDLAGSTGALGGPKAGTPAAPRWLALLGEAVGRASISVEAADIIRTRLGAAANGRTASPEGTPDQSDGQGAGGAADEGAEAYEAALADAAQLLVTEAPGLTIEQLALRASRARDELDLAGVASRQRALHEKRFLRVTRQLDGMTRVSGLLDPESAAIVVPILDAATSPRRGGPRFVVQGAIERAEELVRDQRTTEQLTLDTVVELVRIGSRVDDGRLLGDRKPAVRVLVTKRDLEQPRDASGTPSAGTRLGAAFFEGQAEPVSIETAERYVCATGAVPILFDDDDGRVLNLGREQRLFTERQRVALAVRDGGCLMCDRPPSWCEAHHIDHWDAHHGRTDVDDGVLLCRFCHLLLHNRGWRITRTRGDYFLEHPDDHGIMRRTSLPSRSPALDRLRATA